MSGPLPPSGFGPALRSIRQEKGLTQKQLGEAAGLHPNSIAKLERGEVEPSWQVVIAVSAALGVTCQDFTSAAQPDAAPAEGKPAGTPPAPGPGGRAKGKGRTG
jgi:transcriptional regulator with XRE-family HTH domain